MINRKVTKRVNPKIFHDREKIFSFFLFFIFFLLYLYEKMNDS